MILTSKMRTLLILLLFYAEVKTSGLARYQRGDQGPDNDEVMHIDTNNVITDMIIPPMGGPNVCRSRSRTFCCPGWHQRGTTGLCLVPVCSSDRCGSNGRCIKPNLCLCEGGRIASHCGQNIENEGKLDSAQCGRCANLWSYIVQMLPKGTKKR